MTRDDEAESVAFARAKQLIADGWFQTSAKYRTVTRVYVPVAKQAITFSTEVPEWLREFTLQAYDQWTRWGARCARDKVEAPDARCS